MSLVAMITVTSCDVNVYNKSTPQCIGLKFIVLVCRRPNTTALNIHLLSPVKGTKFKSRRVSNPKYVRMCNNGSRLCLCYIFIRQITSACPIGRRNYVFTSPSPTLDSCFYSTSIQTPITNSPGDAKIKMSCLLY
jgi:hypothetical protein